MRATDKEKRRQYRTIYRLLYENPRITLKDISKIIGVFFGKNRLNEAFEQGRISIPQIRKKSSKNFSEYVYFANCEDPLELFLQYCEDQRVSYHAVMQGSPNLWVISKEEIVIDGDVLVGGLRSDYHISFAPNHSWGTSIKIMRGRVSNFDPEDYQPKGTIETHWDETIDWDEKDEELFIYFKYNMRKPLTPFIKESDITAEKIKKWLKRLPECCTIITRYYPETRAAYDPYIFIFETDYEDFIIDLFSELPTSCLFFKVSDKLILHAYVDREFLRKVGSDTNDIPQLHIPLLIRDLSKKGVLRRADWATVAYHYRKLI